MVIQLAYYSLYKQPCATYESGSTRQCFHGRTENVRTTCAETIYFTKIMDSQLDDTLKYNALQSALQAHRKYMMDAVQGKGCDRHMLGLRILCMEQGLPLPKVFSDTSFSLANYFLLSTSNMPAATFTGG